jgi:alginate O-acetyltransferase complex protein AlgI
MLTLAWLLRGAGGVQLAILAAALQVPRVVGFRQNLASVTSFFRRLVWVYGVFIALVIGGFGAVSLLQANALAAGTPLARAISLFIAIFWLVRLAVQLFVFDARPFRNSRFLTFGYHSLTVAFVYLALVYLSAALWP